MMDAAVHSPSGLRLQVCGSRGWDLSLSRDTVAAARWLLRIVPEDERLSLCDIYPQAAIVRWADARPVLYVEVIRDHWNVSRATAYRWLRALGRENGVEVRTS